MKKIKVAFVKYGGLTTGGSEKLLQILAANLPKEEFEVAYFYSDMVPSIGVVVDTSPTDPFRLKYMQDHNVRCIKFALSKIDLTSPLHTWVDTDFFNVFDEKEFDIIQTCRAGHKEYPFVRIQKKPIIDIIALSSGVDNQYNIARVLHLCTWSKNAWGKRGGDVSRARIVSLPISIENVGTTDLRDELNLNAKWVFGMHQRNSGDIFSPIPLESYAKIENDTTAFILLGGGQAYRDQAVELGLKHVYFLPPTGDSDRIFSFLRTLTVYAHGRKDGEVNSQAIAEAMYYGLPIVSHISAINNGHIECIGDAGVVVLTVKEYSDELKKLMENKNYFHYRKDESYKRFKEHYELEGQIKKYVEIYKDIYHNPFPNKVRRFLMSIHYTQNIRIVLVWIYLKLKMVRV